MAYKGQRKFICLDCEEATYFRSTERGSRFRYRCRWCGSLALAPSRESEARYEIIDENRRLVMAESEFPSDIIKSHKGERSGHRKIM